MSAEERLPFRAVMVLGRCRLITDNLPYGDGSEKASADSLADDDGDGNKMSATMLAGSQHMNYFGAEPSILTVAFPCNSCCLESL